MRIRSVAALLFAGVLAASPVFAQPLDIKAVVVKHLTTSRDFTLRVAEQMPDSDYAFKLTPPQMSFGEQMVHLSEEQAGLLAPFTSAAPKPSKPASMKKADVIAFIRRSYDESIATVSKLTPDQIGKTYSGGEGTMTGLELLMFTLDHCTHHRASAEMYLRAKGITPANYQF
jgi:uncharacterized damage-inducible protein DinB